MLAPRLLLLLVASASASYDCSQTNDGCDDPCYVQPPGHDQSGNEASCIAHTEFTPRAGSIKQNGETITCQQELDLSCFCEDFGGMDEKWMGCKYSRRGWISYKMFEHAQDGRVEDLCNYEKGSGNEECVDEDEGDSCVAILAGLYELCNLKTNTDPDPLNIHALCNEPGEDYFTCEDCAEKGKGCVAGLSALQGLPWEIIGAAAGGVFVIGIVLCKFHNKRQRRRVEDAEMHGIKY